MIVSQLINASNRGAALEYESLRYVKANVAAGGMESYKNGAPSDDKIGVFCARHTGLTFRAQESKVQSKLNVEKYAHIKPF